MSDWLDRTALLLGDEQMHRLQNSRVAVLGLGGVGGAAAEALCRAGIGHLMLVDHDIVSLTNLNRQLLATTDVLEQKKCDVAAARLHSINSACSITAVDQFYLPDNRDFLFDDHPDFILDAIDTVTAKLDLAVCCKERNIPLISCLGTGNRLDPGLLQIGKITDTAGSACPLARVMRRELKKRGIIDLPVCYSTEQPRKILAQSEHGRHAPGSISFVPPVAGSLLASYVVRSLLHLV